MEGTIPNEEYYYIMMKRLTIITEKTEEHFVRIYVTIACSAVSQSLLDNIFLIYFNYK